MFRELRIGGHVETMLYLRLPEFTGPDAEFRSWVTETAQREQAGLDALAGWITGYRNKVRRGIWRVLRNCYDLGVSGGFSIAVSPATSDGEDDLCDTSADDEDDSSEPAQGNPVLDELEVEVWREVAYSTGEILSSPEPVGIQLWWKGYWAAMAWKSGRLYEHKKHKEDKYTIGLHGLERIARADDGDEAVEIAGDDVLDPNSNLNPIVIRELVWTDFDVERELRRAGPFRADDVYGVDGQVIAAA